MLSIKQMEVDILIMLDKHRLPISKPLETDRLARYILSLGSLCKDPRRFYGHDLITLVQHHEPTQDDEFALATLAACSSATHVRKRQIRRLLDIASGEITNIGEKGFTIVNICTNLITRFHRHHGDGASCTEMHHYGSSPSTLATLYKAACFGTGWITRPPRKFWLTSQHCSCYASSSRPSTRQCFNV